MTAEEVRGEPQMLGRYQVFDEIASGGMASVHFGRMLGRGGFWRTVAIKRLHRHLARDPEMVAMFLDEARLAANIHHPNVVETYDVDMVDGEMFIAMQYVPGVSLHALITAASKQKVTIPASIAARILYDALCGLHAAHELCDPQGQLLGLVHRDVSPHNLLVGADGVTRVVDFGVAKARARISSTQGNVIKGKLRYMAPEQVSGRAVDRRADVFAAGIVLWETLTEKRLFEGDNEPGIIDAVLNRQVPRPSQVTPDQAPYLDKVCLRALSRDPDKRYQTADGFAQALDDAPRRMERARGISDYVAEMCVPQLRERADVLSGILKRYPPPERPASASAVIHEVRSSDSTPGRRSSGVLRETTSDDTSAQATMSASARATEKNVPWRRVGIAAAGIVVVSVFALVHWLGGASRTPAAEPASAEPRNVLVTTHPAPSAELPAPTASTSSEPPAEPAPEASASAPAASAKVPIASATAAPPPAPPARPQTAAAAAPHAAAPARPHATHRAHRSTATNLKARYGF